MDNERWPVIITEHREHVVWVEADDFADALDQVKQDGEWYERISDSETLASAWSDFRSPNDDYHSFDWETVYDGDYLGAYQGLPHDDHVQAYHRKQHDDRRAAETAACAAAGHPKRQHDRPIGDETLCPTCGWLPVETS